MNLYYLIERLSLATGLLILVFIFSTTISCGQAEPLDSIQIGFYNVENFFDTKDEPFKQDDEFTPQGRQKWTKERFHKKCQRIARVMKSMEMPDIMGFTEIENRYVLEQLLQLPEYEGTSYDIVHEESPDERGIDVALIYDQNRFKKLFSDTIRISFPYEIDAFDTTRDILHVILELRSGTKSVIHVFVNHWPSRRGGVIESEPRRLYVASRLRSYLENELILSPENYIVIMGDFNDEPPNRSLTETLGANTSISPCNPDSLYNVFGPLDARGKGSYNYRGDWNMTDQMILSGAFICGNSTLRFNSADVFYKDWLMYDDPNLGKRPNRTYGGPNYYGGFSDHLPIKSIIYIY